MIVDGSKCDVGSEFRRRQPVIPTPASQTDSKLHPNIPAEDV